MAASLSSVPRSRDNIEKQDQEMFSAAGREWEREREGAAFRGRWNAPALRRGSKRHRSQKPFFLRCLRMDYRLSSIVLINLSSDTSQPYRRRSVECCRLKNATHIPPRPIFCVPGLYRTLQVYTAPVFTKCYFKTFIVHAALLLFIWELILSFGATGKPQSIESNSIHRSEWSNDSAAPSWLLAGWGI